MKIGIIYEREDKEEVSSARAWAKSIGWSATKISNKMMMCKQNRLKVLLRI